MTSRYSRLVAAAVALLLVAGAPAFAQEWKGKGRLQGEILDPQGNPVEGARITLRQGSPPVDAAQAGPAPVLTNKKGKWSILGLAQGSWAVLIEKDGFQKSEGQVQVHESGPPAPPIRITLNAIPKEAQQAAEASAAGQEALSAIERGNGLLEMGQYAPAREAYEEAMAKLEAVNHPPILRGIARTYFQEKNVDQAIATLKKALAIKPDDVESLKLIVNLLVASDREPEAQVYMAQLPQGQSVDPNTLLNIGIKYFNEGKLDQALAEFDRVVSENPQVPDGYYYRGLVYLNQSKTAEAKADFQKMLELDPNHPQAGEAREFLKSL
jgi:tetratricopeptide (TPR) repeat protein